MHTTFLQENQKENENLGGIDVDAEDNIEMDLKDIVCEGVD
jgi:hypothetical protein